MARSPSRRRTRLLPLAAALLAPVLLGATDPAGDLVACRGGRPSDFPGIDLVTARAELVEEGTALRFVVRFAEPPPEAAPGGRAWRVDVVLRDPRKPDYSFASYRRVNRIVRYDHTDPPTGRILLLAEGAESKPTTYVVRGRTLTITLAGRLLEVDEDLEPASLRPLRWNVWTRFGPTCDRIGDGAATMRLAVVAATAAPSPSPSPTTPTPPPPPPRGDPWLPLSVVVFVVMLAGAWMVGRRVVAGNVEDRTAPEPAPTPDRPVGPQPFAEP